MLVSLTSSSSSSEAAVNNNSSKSIDPKVVGGKAASLAKLYSISELQSHVPKSFALTVDFFAPWMKELQNEIKSHYLDETTQCARLQDKCMKLQFNKDQKQALDQLRQEIKSFGTHGLAAVRSSAPEEDGAQQSFAGAFDTRLGVTCATLESAIRECLASRFDARVLNYVQQHDNNDGINNNSVILSDSTSFAVVVMEMVDSQIAGVAFSANPLNSDRDELLIDSSFGLGESVVDGSVTADHYLYDKVQQTILSTTNGKKTVEKKLMATGGVQKFKIDKETRQTESSLSDEQVQELAKLVCIVEQEYGMPMDIEWAYAPDEKSGDTHHLVLKLLQARPITMLFYIDDNMMTEPGEKRILYYDYNVVSDATTTTPFTHMDMNFYGWASSAMMGFQDRDIFTEDPTMPIFEASTRQYCNLSIFLKYMSTETCAKSAEMLDPYLASIFASKDCDRDKYKMKKLPKDVSLWNTLKLLRQFPFWKLYKIGKAAKKDPEKASLEYQETVKKDLAKFKALEKCGPKLEEGLQSYARELFDAMSASFELELGYLFFAILPLFKELEKKSREGKTEEERSEYSALCGGYGGDGLMELNKDLYRLAKLLPQEVWQKYPHDDLDNLATRIQENLKDDTKQQDLPSAFLEEWKTFMELHGYDGQDQLYPSSPRYIDSPVLLLSKLKSNASEGVTSPVALHEEQVEKRRQVMALHEQQARDGGFWARRGLSAIQTRNAVLEHLMWIRNDPKLHLSQMCGILRAGVLQVQEQLLQSGRLEEKGDIYHVSTDEVDEALRDESLDLMALIRPRKAVYERALRAKECPLLVDSRCRILRPDPPEQGDHPDGTWVGNAVSPGVATGRVRIINSPSEEFQSGEILAAVVTGPAWTPLFAGAAAVILQIGGALQHGALCAREYGKPAVSNIDIHSVLKTGMMVTVDGNTGTIKILDEE